MTAISLATAVIFESVFAHFPQAHHLSDLSAEPRSKACGQLHGLCDGEEALGPQIDGAWRRRFQIGIDEKSGRIVRDEAPGVYERFAVA